MTVCCALKSERYLQSEGAEEEGRIGQAASAVCGHWTGAADHMSRVSVVSILQQASIVSVENV